MNVYVKWIPCVFYVGYGLAPRQRLQIQDVDVVVPASPRAVILEKKKWNDTSFP